MPHATVRAAVCAAVLAGACAFTGTATAASADLGVRDTAASGVRAPANDSPSSVPARVSSSAAVVRDAPASHAPVVTTLPAGAHVQLLCRTTGDHVDGTSTWYFDDDAHGWVSAAHVHPTSWQPRVC